MKKQQRRWAYVDCSFPTTNQSPYGQYGSQTSRPVCKKMKQLSEYNFLTF